MSSARIVLGGLALALLLGVAVPSAGQGPGESLVVRVFTLKYRSTEEAAAVVRPLLTSEGSVLLQPHLKSLTVKDTAAAVGRIGGALAANDVPPRSLSVSVTLLRAGTGLIPATVQRLAAEIVAAGEQLKKMFGLEGFDVLDSVVVQGAEGNVVGFPIGQQFRLDFRIERAAEESVVRLKDLVLSRRREEGGRAVWRDVLKTTLNVTRAQPFVLGIGRDESAQRALFLIFVVRDQAPPSPGPGVR